MLELVVNRWIADRELVGALAVGGMDGWFLAEDNACHQVDEGGEQEFVGVLALGGAGEKLVEVVGIEDSLQDSSGHDADGLFRDEGLKDFVQEHGGFPPHGSFRSVYGGIRDMNRRLHWKGWP
jgi:hypothetical protein